MIQSVGQHNIQATLNYLHDHEEHCQFLINNLNTYGPVLNDHHNTGNFKVISNTDNEIEGVFCLTRRGNLLAQTNGDYSEQILKSCATEPIALKGFIGDWKTIEPIFSKFKERHPEYRPSYESKEILYTLALDPNDLLIAHHPQVRFLEFEDFDQWDRFSNDYMEELHLPENLTFEERRRSFLESTKRRVWWGLFHGNELVSRAALNSKGEKTGQVGGVFTPKSKRQNGYAKATMLHMLKDCRDFHGHNKSILFTGETDSPAQKLYESIGYKKVGHFALILG